MMGSVRPAACGGWRAAGGGLRIVAEIMTSVDIIVRTLSLARPPRQDLTMPHGHGVDNCSFRYSRKGRQLDLGESRSPTQIFQRNLLPPSHRLWVNVCTLGPGLMVMVVMVLVIVMMIVMVMVMVPKALSQVGWLRPRQCQSFHRLKAFYLPKLPETQSFNRPKDSC